MTTTIIVGIVCFLAGIAVGIGGVLLYMHAASHVAEEIEG